MNFKVNERVVHKREGLANIVSMTTMSDKNFFLLKAARGDGEKIFVPVDSCDDIIRPVMSTKEASDVLKYMKSVPLEINPNTKQRRDAYKRMLNTGDVKDIAYLTRQLYYIHHCQSSVNIGDLDIELMKKAKDMLLDELSITFKKARDAIEAFINKKITRL